MLIFAHIQQDQCLPVAGSLAGLSTSVAHAQLCASSSADPAFQSVHKLSPSWKSAATSSEASALETPSHGPHSSADLLLTAPDTQGKQQVVEKIYLASPSQMLAAPTSPVSIASRLPAAGSEMQQLQVAEAGFTRAHNMNGAQVQETPAESQAIEALQQSFTPSVNSVGASAPANLAVMHWKHVNPHHNTANMLADQGRGLENTLQMAFREQQGHTEDAGRLQSQPISSSWSNGSTTCYLTYQIC